MAQSDLGNAVSFEATGSLTTCSRGDAGAWSNYPFLTSKERDNETGLDYFLARYYSSVQGRFTSVDPSRKSIVVTNPQSWNRYAYALNNPLAYVDENGKWPTWVHELIIDRALPRLSQAQRKEIKEGSWSVDNPKNGGQDKSRSNEHGMTIPGQSVEKAAENGDTFINNNVDKAKYAFQNTGLTSSLWDFGRAFHTVSDMTSPAHEGYQTWRWRGGLSHMWNEASITDYRMGMAVGATLALYAYTYGQQELQRATGYVPGSSNDPHIKAINAQFMLPGSRPAGELEAEYEYRRGLRAGLKFDWATQNALRGPQE